MTYYLKYLGCLNYSQCNAKACCKGKDLAMGNHLSVPDGNHVHLRVETRSSSKIWWVICSFCIVGIVTMKNANNEQAHEQEREKNCLMRSNDIPETEIKFSREWKPSWRHSTVSDCKSAYNCSSHNVCWAVWCFSQSACVVHKLSFKTFASSSFCKPMHPRQTRKERPLGSCACGASHSGGWWWLKNVCHPLNVLFCLWCEIPDETKYPNMSVMHVLQVHVVVEPWVTPGNISIDHAQWAGHKIS